MFWRAMTGRRRARTVLFLALLSGMAPAAATAAADAVLYRIFLRDGSVIVSYGEFAHVADQIVVSIPVGGSDTNPVLHPLSIPQGEVEWERTNAYMHAARARRYADTRGEFDFSQLTREVSDTLYQVGTTSDAAKRLALAEDARKRLVEWAPQHFNYRATELAQMTTWLDQVVSELRVAAGQSSFDLALVATPMMAPRPTVELLPEPTVRERVESALAAARRTPDPSQRVSLIETVLGSLAPADAADEAWAAAIRARANGELAIEKTTDRAYADLAGKALARAAALQQKADVRAIESIMTWVQTEDQKLSRARPAMLAGILATLDVRLDAARRLRLAQDAWELRSALVRAYWRDVRQGLDRLLGLREWLIDVRQLAGPAPRSVRRLGEYATQAQRELSAVKSPPEVAAQHSSLLAAAGMAARAATARGDAVRSARMDMAWQASSAAAGALLMIDQAVTELRLVTRALQPTLADCQRSVTCQ